MSILSAIKSFSGRLTRLFFRLVYYTFLLTLPFTFFPLLSGISAGITFHVWNNGQVVQHTNSLLFEVEAATWQNYVSVPGALTFSDYLDDRAPFHIPKITTKDWANKLGVILPNEHRNDTTVGVDKLASLDGLVRSVECADHGNRPKKYWVYVTSLPELRRDPWDRAFSELLQHFYVNPLPLDTEVLYLDCAEAAFLCGVWNVKNPSLLYFTALDESLGDREANRTLNEDNDEIQYTYPFPVDTLHPVTVRVIELPLSGEAASNLLPRASLPVPDSQLRALLLDPFPDDLLAEWDTYSSNVQMTRRFQDHIDSLCYKRGTRDYYINEADHWYTDNVLHYLGLDFDAEILQLVQAVAFGITAGLMFLIRTPFSWAWNLYAWYFGLGWDGSPENTDVYGEQVGEDGAGTNMWEDMMNGFWLQAAQNITAQMSENAARAAVTEA